MSNSSAQKATVQRTVGTGKPASNVKPLAGKTLADFRAAHDPNVIVPAKITKALADMEAESQENWEYENDFMRRAGLSTTNLAMFRPQFEAHVVETTGRNPKRVWFASVKVAEQARGG